MEYGGKFMYQIRTDLELETQEKMQEDHVDLKGVRFLEEKVDKNITVSTVVIETENGAKTMGKPKGTYITSEAGNMDEEDEDYHREISVQLAKIIRQLIQEKNEELSVLVVGLGKREVTPDALGPRVVDNLFITRHIVKEYGKYAFGEKNVNRISSIVPGVMAQTGMESLEIIHGIIDETKPCLLYTSISLNLDYLATNTRIIELICIFTVIFVSVIIAGQMVRPFHKMSKSIDEIQTGYGEDALSVNDYTETKLISEKFNKMLGRMKVLDDSRQEFVSNVSHELKTPLTSMKVLADSINSMEDAPIELLSLIHI